MYIHATPFWFIVCMTSAKGPEIRYSMLYHAVTQCFTIVLCNKHCKLTLSVFHMVVEFKLEIKAILHARVVQNRMLQNCGIDAHRRLSKLLARSSTCYEAQYVRHLISSLYQNRKVLQVLILLLLIEEIRAIYDQVSFVDLT